MSARSSLRLAGSVVLIVGVLSLTGCGNSHRMQSRPVATAKSPARVDVQRDDAKAKHEKEDAAAAGHNTETYDRIIENDFLSAAQHPLSTFSLDVDTASYSNVRRFLLQERRLPPTDAVRLEEMLNYFPYNYAPPRDGMPFATHVEVADCPWNKEHRLVRLGVKGREIPREKRPACNLVFLLDVSGSMNSPNRLPLVKRALSLLVDELTEKDRVALVVYASGTGVALPSTPASQRADIIGALERLQAAGSTHGSAGIQLAYSAATENYIKDGVNRVILCTDGDFNVGVTNRGDLTRMIEEKARAGVFLTVLGFGMGNYKDATLVQLADKGNGNYAYIDTLQEARKVLVEQASGTLVTIAKDVKVQVEFNPGKVHAYRLLGYEKRLLRAQDFNDDTKDAGEIGAGHTVTVLYEVVPAGKKINISNVDPLKYQQEPKLTTEAKGPDLLTLKMRYKEPRGDESKLIEFPVIDRGTTLAQTSEDFRFAAAVAQFGLLLRRSPYQAEATYGAVREMASQALGGDPNGYRKEFVNLVTIAEGLAKP